MRQYIGIFLMICGLLLFVGSYVIKEQLQDRKIAPNAVGEQTPKRIPTRIISLAPSATEVLFSLGLDDKIVGVTRYCKYPAEASKKDQIGGYFDPNYEAIIALKPDLIVMLEEHSDARTALADVCNILTVDHKSISGIVASLNTIGIACGKEKRAVALTESINQRISNIQSRPKESTKPSPKVMVVIGRNMGTGGLKDIYIAGKEPFYSKLLTMAGAQNAFEGTISFPTISPEGIIQMNPEIIIDMVPGMTEKGWQKETILKEWDALPMVDAVKNKQVHIFTEDYIVIPGPRFIQLLEKIDTIIQTAPQANTP